MISNLVRLHGAATSVVRLRHGPRYLFPAMLAVALLAMAGQSLVAEETKEREPSEPPPQRPLLVVHVAALDKVLQQLQTNFKDIDRADVNDAFNERLSTNAGGLKGLDRSKPFGVALFLTAALPPQPVPVVYAPVSDFKDLIKTLELGPMTIKRQAIDPAATGNAAAGERYTLTMAQGGTREIVVRDGYAFLSPNDGFLDGDVASLAKLAPRLGSQYDVAIAIDLKTVSPLVRDVFLGMLRAQSQAELQRRDDEPMSQYIIRKANGLSTLELIEHVLTDGESLTLGAKLREGTSNTILELNVAATPDSDFAQYLADLASHPSSYASLVNDREPLTLSASWMMAAREKRVGREWVSSLAHAMTDRLSPPVETAKSDAEDGKKRKSPAAEFVPHPAVQPVVDALNATVDGGHLDVCFQFRELEPGKMGMIGAMGVVGGATLGGGIRELLTALQAQGADFEIVQDVAKHLDVSFHRVKSKEQRPEDRRVYGDGSALYLGASDKTFWFAVGSSRALTELQLAMDRVAAASTEPATRQAPIQFVMQMVPWLGLSPPENEADDPNAERRRELSDEAFADDNDGIKLEIRPTDTGARVRVELEAGFARMLTLWIAERYDRSRL